MPEEEIMSPEEVNQSYVSISSRAKGPPSITVKVVHKDARSAGEEASDIFNELTRYYRDRWEKEQPTDPVQAEPDDKEAGVGG